MQKRNIRRRVWGLFTPLLVSYAVSFVVEMIVISIYGVNYFQGVTETITTQEQMYKHVEIISEAILPYATQIGSLSALLTIPFLVRMMKKDRIFESQEGFVANKVAPLKQYIFAAVMSVAVAVGLNNILLLLNISEYSAAYQESAELLYMPSFPVQILCLGIIYPILEECIFRGLIFRRMRMRLPAAVAIISSAALFGLYHGNSVQMIYGSLSGVMLAYFYEKYGSLKAPILAHVLMNTVAVILTELDAFRWMFNVPMRMVVITILCAAIGSGMLVFIQKIEHKPDVIVEGVEENNEA